MLDRSLSKIENKPAPSIVYRPFGTMRLFLALLVMLQHYVQWCYPTSMQQFLMPIEPGSVAVLVFFFLSGFVITEAAELIYQGRPGAFFATDNHRSAVGRSLLSCIRGALASPVGICSSRRVLPVFIRLWCRTRDDEHGNCTGGVLFFSH